MKYLQLIILTILFFPVSSVFSQDQNKWLRIETDDKDFSVAFPTTNLVDAEKREFGQRLRIFAFENGVEMEIIFIKSKPTGEFIGDRNNAGKIKVESFKVGDFQVHKSSLIKSGDNGVRHSFTIIKNETLYILITQSKTGMEKEVLRFLYSINLDGKPLLEHKKEENSIEENVKISSLNTSPEITEASKRKSGKIKSQVTYELRNPDEINSFTPDLTHNALIVDKPFPNYRSEPFTGVLKWTAIDIKLRVQFRSDGQIGDIVVLSNADKLHSKATIDAARRIKFVPARRGNEYVDSYQVVSYSVRMLPEMDIIRRL